MSARAVCLVSGGMDSAVALAEARAAGRACFALTVDYGQRHRAELDASGRVARSLGAVEHKIVRVDLASLGGSALTDAIEVPKDREVDPARSPIPPTYVPARNTVFLSVALAWAEVLGAREIWLGVNAVDYSGYPDCRPEFLRAFAEVARAGTAAGTERGEAITIQAPLVDLSKAEIVRRGLELGVDFAETHTCYDPVARGDAVLACGRCDACRIRLRGFEEAGAADPLRYAAR